MGFPGCEFLLITCHFMIWLKVNLSTFNQTEGSRKPVPLPACSSVLYAHLPLLSRRVVFIHEHVSLRNLGREERCPGSGARKRVLAFEARLRCESTMQSCPCKLLSLTLSPHLGLKGNNAYVTAWMCEWRDLLYVCALLIITHILILLSPPSDLAEGLTYDKYLINMH